MSALAPYGQWADDLKSLRVLVADDYPDAAQSLAVLLSSAGLEVRVAQNGDDAVVCARAWQPDIFILDLSMPKLNGLQVAEWVHAEERTGERPLLVALTGWGRAADRERGRAAGFDHYLMKPAEPQEILSAIRKYASSLPRAPDGQPHE